MFLSVESDLEIPTQYVDKFFALVRVRIPAASFRRDAKKMRLHHGVAPSQQLHADSGTRLQHLAFCGTNPAAARSVHIKKVENIRLIKSRQFAKSSHRSTHLRAFECA